MGATIIFSETCKFLAMSLIPAQRFLVVVFTVHYERILFRTRFAWNTNSNTRFFFFLRHAHCNILLQNNIYFVSGEVPVARYLFLFSGSLIFFYWAKRFPVGFFFQKIISLLSFVFLNSRVFALYTIIGRDVLSVHSTKTSTPHHLWNSVESSVFP